VIRWRVEYVAGPVNLQRALADLAREGWFIVEILAHPLVEPRYTVVAKLFPSGEQESAAGGD